MTEPRRGFDKVTYYATSSIVNFPTFRPSKTFTEMMKGLCDSGK